MKIPLINLKHQLNEIREELTAAITKVFEEELFSEGLSVKVFEDQLARVHHVDHCIGLNSGTSSLHAIFLALSIGEGDEVILSANTCFPTVESICIAGATPVFVDCESQYQNINPHNIEPVITKNTKAILAVHLYGHPAPMSELKKIADQHDVFLIEDCAQAHLASYDGIPVGNFGIAGALSFYPTKNLGAFGESGAVITNDQKLAHRVRAFKNHGSFSKNVHESIGHNYRMDTIQAAILSVKLNHLVKWTEKRQRNALLYHNRLSNIDHLVLPKEHTKAKHVYHLYVVQSAKRDQLRSYLDNLGIETAIHYPIPCHLQPALNHLPYLRGSFPVSERLSKEILTLPVAEHLTEDNICYISECIRRFMNV